MTTYLATSYQQFVNDTAPDGFWASKLKRRGANIALVDMTLQEWNAQKGTASENNEKVQLLYLIAKECNRWLQKKRGQIAKRQSFMPH